MTSGNFSCIVCVKNLTAAAEIVSTQCGHVFHALCLKQRHEETPQCPQCLSEIKNTIRLHLHFESGFPNKDHQIAELRSEIDHLYKTRTQLQNEFVAKERELQNLQGQFNKKNEEIDEKNKKLDILALQIKDYAKDAATKTIEIHKLKETLNSKNPQALSSAFQEEIKVLKEKNRQISMELSKEIRNSSQLTTDKIRFESMLHHLMNNQTDNNENPQNENATISKTDFSNEQASKGTDAEEKKNEDFVQSVVIKNIRETFEDEEAIKRYVYRISDLMGLYFTGDDIAKVAVLNRWQGNKMSLVVKFKTLGMKSTFLSRKDRLKLHDEIKHLFLYEYVTDNTHLLFQQAKSLRFLGFQHVYCRNNVVLVKKKQGAAAITINCRDDIEKLKAEVENPAAV